MRRVTLGYGPTPLTCSGWSSIGMSPFAGIDRPGRERPRPSIVHPVSMDASRPSRRKSPVKSLTPPASVAAAGKNGAGSRTTTASSRRRTGGGPAAVTRTSTRRLVSTAGSSGSSSVSSTISAMYSPAAGCPATFCLAASAAVKLPPGSIAPTVSARPASARNHATAPSRSTRARTSVVRARSANTAAIVPARASANSATTSALPAACPRVPPIGVTG